MAFFSHNEEEFFMETRHFPASFAMGLGHFYCSDVRKSLVTALESQDPTHGIRPRPPSEGGGVIEIISVGTHWQRPDFRHPPLCGHFASARPHSVMRSEGPVHWVLVEMPGRGRRQSRGPQSSPERKKLGDAARVASARAETGVPVAGAASSPARRGARSALAASRRRPAEVSARPLTPPPTSSTSPPRTPHPCADALQPSFAGGSETKAHCRE